MIEAGQSELITEAHTPAEILEITDKRVEYLWDKVNSPTNNPRMLLQSEKDLLPNRIIYFHEDINGNVVYIGEGDLGRAGDCVSRRDPAHSRWMLEQLFNRHDYVKIIEQNLTKVQARVRQDKLIAEHNPKFNRKKTNEISI